MDHAVQIVITVDDKTDLETREAILDEFEIKRWGEPGPRAKCIMETRWEYEFTSEDDDEIYSSCEEFIQKLVAEICDVAHLCEVAIDYNIEPA